MAINVSQLHPALAFNSKKKEYLLVWMRGKGITATRINTNAFPKDYDDQFRLITADPFAKVSEPMKMSLTYCEKYDEFLLVWPDKVTKPGSYSKESESKTLNLQALVLEGDDAETKAAFMVGEKAGTTRLEEAPVFESDLAEMFSQHDQMAPATAYCPIRDEYLIVWCDYEKGAQKHLYGLRIRADDKMPMDTVPIRLVDAETNQKHPSLVWSAQQGEYMMVWGDDGEGLNIRGERISPEGKPHGGGSFDIIPERREKKRNQTQPSLAYNPVDGYHSVVWIDWTLEGQAVIMGRRLNENGFPIVGLLQDRPFLMPIISRKRSDKKSPVVGADYRVLHRREQSDFVVLWADDQNHEGVFEIFGHRLNENAFPFDTPNFVVVQTDFEPTGPSPGPGGPPVPPSEVQRISLTPQEGMAGYVVSSHPKRNFLTGQIFAGFFWGRLYHGMIQFDLSSIPPGSRVVSATLEMRGRSRKYMDQPHGGVWSVKILHPAFDTSWKSHRYNLIHTASVAYVLAPMLENQQLTENAINRFDLEGGVLSHLTERLSRGMVSFRVDGPDQYTNLFLWDSPVLHLTYAKPIKEEASEEEEEVTEEPVPPEPVHNLEEALVAEAEVHQVISFNPDAALQKHIFAADFVPNSAEFDLEFDDVQYLAQRAEHLGTGKVRVYYVVVGDWGNVKFIERD